MELRIICLKLRDTTISRSISSSMSAEEATKDSKMELDLEKFGS